MDCQLYTSAILALQSFFLNIMVHLGGFDVLRHLAQKYPDPALRWLRPLLGQQGMEAVLATDVWRLQGESYLQARQAIA